MYSVHLAPLADRFYAGADRPLAQKLARCFRSLERNPLQHPNIKRLTGPLRGLFRFRVGDHRVIYRVEEEKLIVLVIEIVHRGSAY